MIYPTYAVEGIKDPGTMLEILQILNKLHLNSVPIAITDFWVNGYRQEVIIGQPPQEVPILNPEEFIEKYNDFYRDLVTFITSLQLGDQVVIEDRRLGDHAYPYSFVNEMTKWSGKTMTINRIGSISESGRQFDNGSNLSFYMKEDEGSFTWHSSMFVMGNIKPITKLIISDLKTDPLNISELQFPF